jgi:3',5'-cyclic AMP phosphodiesterase CpdA
MADRAIFLHLTDPHVSEAGVAHVRDDAKVTVPAVPAGTRENVLTRLFTRLGEHLARTGANLDGVIFSGDAQSRGDLGGHELVFGLVIDHLGPFGVTPDRIVATPGNHDVPRDSLPSSPQRYEAFTKVWRNAGCVVPWLDGVDPIPSGASFDRHRLVAADGSWAVFPVNTSNWANVTSILPKPLSEVWDAIPETLAPADQARADKIRSQLQALARYDMARLSEHQLEALRAIMEATPGPKHGRQLRIAVMHHHLRSPSLREELKPFADISNLEQVRALLRGGGVDIVMHGHKHEHAAYYDHIYADAGDDAHRMLVISGATFRVGSEHDAMRLITIDGLPHVPAVTIEPLPLPRAGAAWRPGPRITRRLWVQTVTRSDPVTVMPGAPVVVEGSDIDEVYARACAAASSDAARGTLIVHLDLPEDDGNALPLPLSYPLPAAPDGNLRERWLHDLVTWWQLDRSQLEHRIPYVHGSRLRRYGGKINQIKRIIELLRIKESTRAIAVLVDPFRDFNPDGTNEEFASFCLVEFRRRSVGAASVVVDAIAFYRAQEFARWWPVNVAELRLLQQEIGASLGFRPGRITTIAADARTIARSPTQVAMPIIDRWLDQAPERLHLLADAMVYRAARSDEQRRAIAEWRRALVEIRSATEEYNSDGVPIAIEGLRTLAAFIHATAKAGDAEATVIAAQLRALADHNEGYERSKRERSDFRLWAPTAERQAEELERLTAAMFG